MPHITFPLADLRALSGLADLTLAQVGQRVTLVKGELKARHSSEDEVKVELQDTNRPDTWCVEGIARHLRQHARGDAARHAFFDAPGEPAGALEVDASVEAVRPYVAGFLAEGYTVDDAGLRAFIGAQEVLCRNFGRQRKGVAIGIYDGARLRFPVRYEAVDADDRARAFVPLPPSGAAEGDVRDGAGQPIAPARWEQPWTPAEILRDHPTGREYAAALPDPSRAPLLTDAGGEVLSFPPLINSAGLGRVVVGMDRLFVEVTGTTLDQVLLATNILAANLADRGATIRPVVTRYPFDTPRGREVIAPHPLAERRTVDLPLADLRRLLGEPALERAEVERCLRAYGVEVAPAGDDALTATIPAWRNDYLHAVDALEDFAISRGYDAFLPLLPEEFTVGGVAPETAFADLLRDRLIGCGFEETIGNILTSAEELRARMQVPLEGPDAAVGQPLHGGKLVKIKNVMNRNYSALRDWLLPTLLQVEANSTSALYPHRFFESGEVCNWDAAANLSTRTELRLGAALADHEAGISAIQAYLHEVLRTLGVGYEQALAGYCACYTLEATVHPSFIPGRTAWIVLWPEGPGKRSARIGLLGEVHPAVLDAWGIRFPVAAFELTQEPLRVL